MDIRDWQLFFALILILVDISFRFYKLRNEEMHGYKKLFHEKYNLKFDYGPIWLTGAFLFILILII